MTYEEIKHLENKSIKEPKYTINDKKYEIMTYLENEGRNRLSELKISYILTITIDNSQIFVILNYSKNNGFDFLFRDDILKYPYPAYQVSVNKILNQSYKSNPFYQDLKQNTRILNKFLFSFEDTKKEYKKQLLQIALDNISTDVYKNLIKFDDAVFNKSQLPIELNKMGRNIAIEDNANLIEFIERYAFGHRQLMLFGEKGTGKTYTIRKFIDKNNWQLVKIDGHAGLDEYSLLGHLIKTTDGNFSWKNGTLAEAFRRASLGERVVVFIDEILRMNPQTLNLLITAMDPYNGYYELELDNPITAKNGDINSETLKASVQNLWFICATNIGANYEVNTMDEAFKDRFILKEIKVTSAEISNILKSKLISKNLNYPVDNFMNFYAKLTNLYLAKQISHKINLRHLTDIIEYAIEPDDIKILCEDKIFAWVGLNYNGEPIEDEIRIIKDLIKSFL